MVYFKVLLNDKRSKSDSIYPVVIRVTFNRNNTTFNTGIRVKSNLWDATSLVVKHSHPNAQAYNKTISEFCSRIQNFAYQLINEGLFSFEDLNSLYKVIISLFLELTLLYFLTIFYKPTRSKEASNKPTVHILGTDGIIM